MVDINEYTVNKAFKVVNSMWKKEMGKGKRTPEEVNQFNSMITTSTSISDLKDCDLVIEAVNEDIIMKQQIFQQLSEVCKPETILASNTSALSITEIGASSGRPDKVIGMHFFNPVWMMKLIEVTSGELTSQETEEAIVEMAPKIGKESVVVKETPGFIVNRVIIPYINEAANLLEEGVASAEQIDKAVKLGANMPMGPLALADLIGLDIVVQVSEKFQQTFGEAKYHLSGILKELVKQGHLGKKTGKGFYEYVQF
jgi:3-hydroxybutyryl-CoA dehydrogenase